MISQPLNYGNYDPLFSSQDAFKRRTRKTCAMAQDMGSQHSSSVLPCCNIGRPSSSSLCRCFKVGEPRSWAGLWMLKNGEKFAVEIWAQRTPAASASQPKKRTSRRATQDRCYPDVTRRRFHICSLFTSMASSVSWQTCRYRCSHRNPWGCSTPPRCCPGRCRAWRPIGCCCKCCSDTTWANSTGPALVVSAFHPIQCVAG